MAHYPHAAEQPQLRGGVRDGRHRVPRQPDARHDHPGIPRRGRLGQRPGDEAEGRGRRVRGASVRRLQAYCAAAADSGSPPAGASYTAYNGASYPYWFKDTNKNGVVDATETTAMKFDSKSLRAVFNYQYYQK
jgi:hypothetical protein